MSKFDINALEQSFREPTVQASFAGLYQSLGLITAIASSPEKIEPAEWIEQLKASPHDKIEFANEEQAKELTDNLVGWWQYCTTFFDHGHHLKLPEKLALTNEGEPNEPLAAFAEGYLKGYDWLSTTWQQLLPKQDDEATRSLLVLNLILGRFVNDKAVLEAEPEIYEQLPDLKGCFKALPSLLSAVGMLGIDLANKREEQLLEQAVHQPITNNLKNIGRNDPCPCGSGKKFKKCCLH